MLCVCYMIMLPCCVLVVVVVATVVDVDDGVDVVDTLTSVDTDICTVDVLLLWLIELMMNHYSNEDNNDT
jgi:hypothetical protein